MDKKFGIDVSKHQGNFDFNAAKKEGVEFVILRGAMSNTKDIKFEDNYKAAKSLELPVGVYQYSKATTTTEAAAEAEYFFNEVLKGKQFELPVYIDIEDKIQKKLSKQLLTNIVKTWCDFFEKKGYFVGVYSYKAFFDENLYDDELQRYSHWVAQWGNELTYSGLSVGMWQFGGETNKIRSNKVSGVVCDQNYMFVDFPEIIKKGGFNGFEKPLDVTHTYDEIKKKFLVTGSKVKVKKGASDYTGHRLASFVYDREHIVSQINGDRAVITYDSIVVAAVKTSDLIIV